MTKKLPALELREERSPAPHFERLEPGVLLSAVAAFSAADFVDSIGVNVRLNNLDTPYGNRYDDVKEALIDLGVTHIRNVAPEGDPTFGENPNRWGTYIQRLNDLAEEGIKSSLTFNQRKADRTPEFGLIDEMLDRIQTHLRESVESVIGLNEYDINAPQRELDNGTWDEVWRDYQQSLYDQVNDPGRPTWVRDLDVVAGPTAFPRAIAGLGDVTGTVDIANNHYYTESRPKNNVRLNAYLDEAPAAFGDAPRWLTEAGYNTATLTTGGVSDVAAGKYTPRFLLENFRRGVERTYLYEFWSQRNNGLDDRQSHFGLIKYDGSRTPSFYGVRSLIDILGGGSDGFTPGSLNYSLSGDTGGVQRALFQKSDGRFYLVLWQSDAVWNTNATPADPPSGDLSNTSQRVTVNFHQDVDRVRRFADLSRVQGGDADQTVEGPRGAISLDVPDEVVVLEIIAGDGRRIELEHAEQTLGTAWADATEGGVRHAWVPNGQGRSGSAGDRDRLAYTITGVPAGTYNLRIRANVDVQGPDGRGENNSFYLRVNGGAWRTVHLGTDQVGWFTQTEELGLDLKDGDNLVEVANRENGTRVDWIEFVDDPQRPDGDYDTSGQVDQGDLNLVLNHWGASPDALPAAWRYQRPVDGIVDQAELSRVLQNWGRTGDDAVGESSAIRVEAEAGDPMGGDAWQTVDETPRHIWVPNEGFSNYQDADRAPRLTFVLEDVPSGDYSFRVRANADSEGSERRGENNSLSLRVNGGGWSALHFATNRAGWFTHTFDFGLNLEGGTNTIELAAREDGTRLDWFELI